MYRDHQYFHRYSSYCTGMYKYEPGTYGTGKYRYRYR